MVRPQTVIDSWKTVRQDTVQALEDFPAAELGFKPSPDLATFGEIARHILDAGHALTGMLLGGVEDMSGPQFREIIPKYAPQLPKDLDAATLAAELRASMDGLVPALAARDGEFYSHIITRFDGQQMTRLEMLQFVKEHELTHRQQLFMYLRLKGIVPATTRRRLAKQWR
ncbi:MAG: DinB family protein [Candidatus Solibacter usitatus]|nr:DinB family protein [Candidatus Solibacter usitatus]